MNPTLSMRRTDGLPDLVPRWPEHFAQLLGLFRQLESSLVTGQQALLARNLPALNYATQEQARLVRELANLWPHDVGPVSSRALIVASAGELSVAARSVMYEARVHLALLERLERGLRMWSNLLAGPEAAYGNCAKRGCRLAAAPTGKEAACPA
jgi:hypothetical protein